MLTLGSLNDVSNLKVTLASEPLYARLFTLPSYFYPVNLLDQILQLILLSTDCTFYLAQFWMYFFFNFATTDFTVLRTDFTFKFCPAPILPFTFAQY